TGKSSLMDWEALSAGRRGAAQTIKKIAAACRIDVKVERFCMSTSYLKCRSVMSSNQKRYGTGKEKNVFKLTWVVKGLSVYITKSIAIDIITHLNT
ncbi:hypothetical protein ACFL4X_01840, partial [Gemmatimonadota bacterium]